MIPLTHVFDESVIDSSQAVARRSPRNGLTDDDALRRAEMCGVLLQMALAWPVILNREAVDFARGIADIMVWSAEHARTRAIQNSAVDQGDAVEWTCTGCGETVPDNFELCWNCERNRPE